jgi:hypothetical protein
LFRERSLPPKVRGPVLREALRMLALSLRFEINGDPPSLIAFPVP